MSSKYSEQNLPIYLPVKHVTFFADGDLGVKVDSAKDAFRQQQHRMVWERRHQRSLVDGRPLAEDGSENPSD